MIPPAFPESEGARLNALRKYEILDTLPEQVYDDLVFLASHVCRAPIALVSFVDHDRQWFKSKMGLEAMETPRKISFCGHAILQNDLFIVEDALADVRFRDNPLVSDYPNIRFYAGAPIKTDSGENIGTICVIDSVPRTLSNAEKNSLLALSRQVVSQLELRLASHEAVSAAQAKSHFLANMSHEIRTPMNAITSCTDLLIDSIKDESQLQLLKLMHDAGSSLMTLINDVLDFSKAEFDSVDLCETAFNLHSVASDTVDILKTRATENKCVLGIHIADSVPEWIVGDAERLRQILFNLIGNAIKFCSRTVTISLSVEQSVGDQNLLFKVEDDGAGIPLEDQHRIFNRFTQASTDAPEGQTGTGLGLAICQDLCTAMKGQLWVDSEPGNGAAFCFQIPLQAATTREEPREEQNLSCIAPGMGSRLPLDILVAEDSEVNQLIIRAMLDKLGYEVTVVSNGIEAFEACQCGNYDVVLMDIKMPKMDGVEATLKIRASEVQQPTIIALTANAFEDDREVALSAGMDGFLTKPINLEAVAQALGLVQSRQPVTVMDTH